MRQPREAAEPGRYKLWIPGKLVTLNTERKGNRWGRAAITADWRTRAAWLAKASGIPPLTRVTVAANPQQSRGVLADAGNHLPSVKAAVDGLVDAGILRDDSPKYVTALIMAAPVRGDDGLHLTLTIEKETP